MRWRKWRRGLPALFLDMRVLERVEAIETGVSDMVETGLPEPGADVGVADTIGPEADVAGADAGEADAINRVPTGCFWELVGRVERVPALRLFVRVAIVLSDSKK